MSAPPPQPETIARLSEAVFPSFAMLAGMQLDVFSPLEDGPLDSAQIAAAIQVESAKLGPLLYALVAAGLLQVEDGLFSNTSEAAHFLVRGRPDFLGDCHYLWADIWHAVLQTGQTIRSGQAQALHDFNAMPAGELEAFLGGLHPKALAAGKQFADNCDLSSCHTLLDVGGGSGGFAIGLTQRCPHLRVTVADLPRVTPIAQRFIDRAKANDKVQALTLDLARAPASPPFDAAVLKNFIQILGPAQARDALGNVWESLKPNAPIYVIGDILDDSRLSPEDAVLFNLVFINVYEEGRAHTQNEYSEWLEQAGFEQIEFLSPEMIRAQKPDL